MDQVKRRLGSCDSCLAAKAKCSGGLPCDRCYQICIRCTGRAQNAKEQVFVDKVLTLVNLRSLAQLFLHTACKMHSKNNLSVEGIKFHMRMWRATSLAATVDMSWGLLDDLIRTFNISPTELEGKDSILLDRLTPPPPDPAAHKVHVKPIELSETPTFKRLDDGVSGFTVAFVAGGQYMVGTNGAGGRRNMTAAEVRTSVGAYKALPSYIFASMVAPADRALYFEGIISTFVNGNDTPFSAFVKLADREGEVDLYHIKFRLVPFPELGGSRGFATWIERLPQSHHVTRMPEHRHRRLDAFRKREPAPAGAGGYSPYQVPPIACVPLDAMPPPTRPQRAANTQGPDTFFRPAGSVPPPPATTPPPPGSLYAVLHPPCTHVCDSPPPYQHQAPHSCVQQQVRHAGPYPPSYDPPPYCPPSYCPPSYYPQPYYPPPAYSAPTAADNRRKPPMGPKWPASPTGEAGADGKLDLELWERLEAGDV